MTEYCHQPPSAVMSLRDPCPNCRHPYMTHLPAAQPWGTCLTCAIDMLLRSNQPSPERGHLTYEDAQAAQTEIANSRCTHCGALHARACPRVKVMKWHSTGQLAEVEFWPDGEWDDTNVIYPEEIEEALARGGPDAPSS